MIPVIGARDRQMAIVRQVLSDYQRQYGNPKRGIRQALFPEFTSRTWRDCRLVCTGGRWHVTDLRIPKRGSIDVPKFIYDLYVNGTPRNRILHSKADALRIMANLFIREIMPFGTRYEESWIS